MHLILAGATGLVGSAVLDAMLQAEGVTKITIISRRPVPMAQDSQDPRIQLVLHQDFLHYGPDVLKDLAGASGCVWALGIGSAQVNKESYVKVTMDYALEAAKAFWPRAPGGGPFRFVYISCAGATLKPGPFTSNPGRIKGETEAILAAMRKEYPSFHACTMRPGFVDRAAHEAIKPYAPSQGIAKSAMQATLAPIRKTTSKSSWSPTGPLGQFLVELAMGRWDEQLAADSDVEKLGDFPVIENSTFRRLKGLDQKRSSSRPRLPF
ncbi:nucleoside-diphosphate-sugar epimerase [Thozetella sp. PMI_491]|nr:nucleoside-diphosphate-sugar epimerase [Thozetella sp. PMI_491]